MSLRSAAKRATEIAMVSSGAAAISRRRRRAQAVILAYHNVVPDTAPEAGDRPLHLPLSDFTTQLDVLARTHDVVPLDDLLEGDAGTRNRPRAALTFDDAYRGAVTIGAKEASARGLPLTIFVAPSFLGGGVFWWDALAQPGRGLDSRARNVVLGDLRGSTDEARRWAKEEGHPWNGDLPALFRCADERELLDAARLPGVTLGSHTLTHPNLSRLERPDLAVELAEPLRWLRARVDRPSSIISYPYGEFNADVEAASAEAGYRGGIRIEGGWMWPGMKATFAIPRINIPSGVSLNGFRLRTSGLMTG